VDALPNLGRGVALQIELHHLHAMAQRPAYIFLLGTEGHSDVLGSQRLQVATDGAQAAVEDAKGQVLGGQQGSLIQGFVGHAHDLPPAQSDRALWPLLGEAVAVILLTSIEGQDDRHHLTLGQRLVARLVGRDGGHGQLAGLDGLRLGKPGEVDFLDQLGEGLGLELGAAQPFLGPHDEDLVQGLNSQAIQLFTFKVAYHLADLLLNWGSLPHILQYLPYGTTIVRPA